ncbi:hypothetical protein GC101_17695 [Paenibacillus sp. LMG 31459]|uniref:SHOCT domain-containing protein n=1 Tax=Paenibacillus phytohabitans TaxID=2654978 RepID=A0ABX1YI49_9BACL|nr:hypothetical protein [Paenibacillus phytohabitans]NOU80700.1 hypothetical protein [Paenibacillus phytohabitans]
MSLILIKIEYAAILAMRSVNNLDQESYEHAQKIEHLRGIDPKKLAQRRLNDLIQSYKNGDISADDLRRYTNIDPESL